MSWKSVIVIFIIFFFTSAVAINNGGGNVYVFLIGGATSIAVAFADAYGNK